MIFAGFDEKKSGKQVIDVSYGPWKTSFTVSRVDQKPEPIIIKSLSASPSTNIIIGGKVTIKAITTPLVSSSSLKWTSSNTSYATVRNGVVTPKKAGVGHTVTITAQSPNSSSKKTIKIKIVKNPIKKITVNAPKTVKAGSTFKIVVKTDSSDDGYVTIVYPPGPIKVIKDANGKKYSMIDEEIKIVDGVKKYFYTPSSAAKINGSKGQTFYVVTQESYKTSEGYTVPSTVGVEFG